MNAWLKLTSSVALAGVLAMVFSSVAYAGEEEAVRAVMQATVDKTIAILKDPELKGDAKKQVRRDKILATLLAMTDARRVSLLTLGRQRSKFSEAQIEQFSEAFRELVFTTYIANLEKYSDEQVKILSVETKEKGKAYAQTLVVSAQKETPADFSFFKDEQGAWKVYDLTVEGVSMVSNYRTQFSELLLKMSPDALIAHLKEKAKENEVNL